VTTPHIPLVINVNGIYTIAHIQDAT